ncbi:cell wall-binding repeat-containing protein [Clostridium tertium]|uniref:cell wall-binding repeat-containing protein n=1 Tax=Clostridium tertium TaxID=1559 RepID=UPI00189F31A1|nr:cell wall-binding repeat-containing protein [Clostridium tertium]MDB1948008.1 cell wall-binding repeat-containing protein [Clostridium tertium]
MKKIFLKTLILSLSFISISTFSVQAFPINYVAGKNRYETAALIADKLQYSSAILVNGLSLVDGLSASGLSGTLDAPILLTETNNIPDSTLKRIEKVKTIYLVGGEGVISKNIEDKLKKLGKTIVRLGGKDRFLTSYSVANEIEKIKPIEEIYYVNGLIGEADAMSIAPVAANTGNPVILTDGKTTEYKRNIKSYTIGGIGVLNESFDKFSERLNGKNRFETNKNVIEKFFPNRTHLNLSKADELIDALTSSALKEPVVLIDNNSDKTVIAGTKSLTVFGDINQTAINRAKGYVYSDKVVFYSQHQDDETIFAGSAIVDAIQAVGAENVYVVLISDGDESGVFNNPRYSNLSLEKKTALRNNEFRAATAQLGILEKNLVFLNQSEKNLDENLVKNTVLDFESKFSNVTHVTHSYKYDLHEQHLKTGNIIYDLYKSGQIKDCKFFGRKELIPTNNNRLLIESISDNETEKNKILKACFEYKLDNRDMIREGIGYKSVSSLFDALTSDPLNISYQHEPGL